MPVKKVIVEKANRLYRYPPEIMSFVSSKRKRSLRKKADILDLANFNWPIGFDYDEGLSRSVLSPVDAGKLEKLKEELAGWYLSVHGARINPAKEVFIGAGISSSVFGLALAFIDNGDIAFVPDLGIPLYKKVTAACGGESVRYSISLKDNWRPNFERVGTQLGRVARVLFVNSPHNPTGAELGEKEMADLVWLAGRENIMVINDAAYQTVSERKIVSLMGIEGGRKVGVEVGSFAYHFGLPPLPFGFVVGNREMINGLQASTALTRQYIPDLWADMALDAIRKFPGDGVRKVRYHIDQSLAEATRLLELMKLEKSGQETTPFIWAKIDHRRQATRKVNKLYRRNRILVASGTSFGESGEGFLRFSLTPAAETYRIAFDRLKQKRRLTTKLVKGK